MAFSQAGNALGISILMAGDAFAIGLLLETPAFELFENGGGDSGDQAGAAGDGATEMGAHLIGVGEDDEDRLPEVFALAGLDQSYGDAGPGAGIPGDRKDFGDAPRDFGVRVCQVIKQFRKDGFAELDELFLCRIAYSEVVGAESGNELGGGDGLGRGRGRRRGREDR